MKIDFNLSGNNWKYVFWREDKMETKHRRLKRAIFKYLLGDDKEEKYIISELNKIYKGYNLTYKNKLIRVSQ